MEVMKLFLCHHSLLWRSCCTLNQRLLNPPSMTKPLVLLFLLVSSTLASGQQCPEECSCFKRTVYCRSKELDYIPGPFPHNTLRINLGGNSITRITREHFRNLLELEELLLDESEVEDIEHGAFSGLSSLRVLDLSYNRLRLLQGGLFYGLRNLRQINLDHNQLERLPINIFQNLYLEELTLHNNKLHDLQDELFTSASVQKLQLDSNDIVEISRTMMGHLKSSLRHLDLSHNKHPLVLDTNAFDGFSFQNLALCNNGLTDTSFLNSTRARSLDIGANPFESVDFESHSNLKFTSKLFMRNVTMRHLGGNMLKHLKGVSLLDFTNTEMESLDASVFQHTPYLDTLYLDNNNLVNIPHKLGEYAPKLKVLKMSYNQVSVMSPDALTGLLDLTELELNNNKIQIIPEQLRDVFTQLDSLGLEENPLHCNCEMRWFKEWLFTRTETTTRVKDCVTPEPSYLWYMVPDEFRCSPPEITMITSNMTVTPDTYFYLVCFAESDPAPVIEWQAPFAEVISITPPSDRSKYSSSAVWKITRVQVNQAGIYTCTAKNIAGTVSQRVCVQLKDEVTGENLTECVFPTDAPSPETSTQRVVTTSTGTVVVTTAEGTTTADVTTADSSTPVEKTSAESSSGGSPAVALVVNVTQPATTWKQPNPSPTSRYRDEEKEGSVVTTVAVACGAAIFLLLLVLLIVYVIKRRRRHKDYSVTETKESQA